MLKHSSRGLLPLLLAGALAAGAADAAIIAPVAITSSTAATDLSPAGNAINGAGLPDVSGNHFFGDFGDSWVTDEVPGFPAKYDFAGQMPVLTIDLGADVSLDGIFVWGYSFGSTSGQPQGNTLASFSLRFATDAEGTGGFGTSIGFNPTYDMDPDNVLSGGVSGLLVPREDFAFGQVVQARWVEMTVLDNFWGQVQPGSNLTFDGGDRVGFGELRFSEVDATVPAPASLTLVLASVLAFGVCGRRATSTRFEGPWGNVLKRCRARILRCESCIAVRGSSSIRSWRRIAK